MFRSIIILLALFISLCFCDSSIEHLSKLFRFSACIEASLANIEPNVALGRFMKDNNYAFVDASLTELRNWKNHDMVSILSELHEIAVYNGIQYQYTLDNEEGPAHAKLFTLTLTMGREKYTGQGHSLKKAQQNAASLAIAETIYPKPPMREKQLDSNLTPVALLNELCTNLGISIKFSLIDDAQDTASSRTVHTIKTFYKKLNDSTLDEELHIRKDLPQSSGPFHVKLEVGQDNVFYGVAQSIKVAKHEAASSALEFFIKNKDKMDFYCLKEGSEEQCRQARQKIKSPVSLIHEAGQARKLGVEFNVISEAGKSHRKTFVTECILGDKRTIGEGSSKKESKRAAAENMIAIIETLDPLPLAAQLKKITNDPKHKKKRKKNKVIKTNFDIIRKNAEQLIDGFVSNFGKGKDAHSQNENSNESNRRKEARQESRTTKSYQNTILDLTNFLDTEIQYMDLENGRYSLLAIYMDPEYLCLGYEEDGISARENAALHGLKLLHKIGLMEHYDAKIDPTTEREIKDHVDDIMEINLEEES